MLERYVPNQILEEINQINQSSNPLNINLNQVPTIDRLNAVKSDLGSGLMA